MYPKTTKFKFNEEIEKSLLATKCKIKKTLRLVGNEMLYYNIYELGL